MSFLVVIESDRVDRVLFIVETAPTPEEENAMLGTAIERSDVGENAEVVGVYEIQTDADELPEDIDRPYIG